MSLNPFHADTAIAERHQLAAAGVGVMVVAEIEALVGARKRKVADNLGSVLLASEADALVARHGLQTIEELMLLALPAARKLAQPPISAFFVGAVGLERETGNLILGGNVEFPRTHLGFTVHGEGFVFTRAFSRGTSIAAIALGEAHPCAHCRQYLSEFAAVRDLTLIDTLGHRLTMAELYPWPFDPGYLGETGAGAGAVPWPDLALGDNGLPTEIAAKLVETGRRAHTPYSKCPSAVVLKLTDGSLLASASIESVAFNPTMGPLQAALIDLLAHGYTYADIASVTLGRVPGGAVDYSRSVSELLNSIAPNAPLTIAEWAS